MSIIKDVKDLGNRLAEMGLQGDANSMKLARHCDKWLSLVADNAKKMHDDAEGGVDWELGKRQADAEGEECEACQ